MPNKLSGHIIQIFSLSVLLISITSCFTGIETTKKIELSRQDRRQLVLTPEETLLDDLSGRLLREWKSGDRFQIAASKIALLFDNPERLSPSDSSLTGRLITFERIDSRLKPDRTEECVIVFADSIGELRFPTGMSRQRADTSIISTRVSLIIDLETVDEVNRRLSGKTLWTRSSLWYSLEGEKVTGRKFVPVTVKSVLPGSSLFPIKVIFDDENGESKMMWMNYTSHSSDSRSFPILFSLSDRRKDFPHISDEIWRYIQNGDLKKGMTKEECRLSLGNPSDVASGHNHSETLDIWQYPNGMFLRFADGLLVDFRR